MPATARITPSSDLNPEGTRGYRHRRLTMHTMAEAPGRANGRPVVRDTLVSVPASVLNEVAVLRIGMLWTGSLPRDSRLHVFAADEGDGDRGGYADMRVTLADTANAHAMSGIVIGEPGNSGPLARDSYRVAAHSDHIALLGESFRLFYESYGLEQDDALGTTIVVRRIDQSNLEALRERFGGRSSTREIQFENLAELDPRGIVVQMSRSEGICFPVSIRSRSG